MRNTTRCPACGLAMGAKDLPQHTSSFEGGPARACAAAAAGDVALLEAMRVHGANLRASCDSGDSPIRAATSRPDIRPRLLASTGGVNKYPEHAGRNPAAPGVCPLACWGPSEPGACTICAAASRPWLRCRCPNTAW